MPENIKIRDLFDIPNRFFRSVHLERDFNDPLSLDGYILTSQILLNLERLIRGLSLNSGQRAWRITGDYGSGKSSFALVLACLFSGKIDHLPKQLQKSIDLKIFDVQQPKMLPVLVTGSHESLAVALLRSLLSRIRNINSNENKLQKIADRIKNYLNTTNKANLNEAVLEFISETTTCLVNANEGTGILIIFDELGKFLEFSSLNPECQDVYFLQNLAEVSTRSNKAPIFVVGLLHQGFNAYAEYLSQSAQREWEKVAGRFEELLFNQPLEQIAILVANTLKIRLELLSDNLIKQAKEDMGATFKLGWYGSSTVKEILLEHAEKLYPLHPTVLPVLVKLFIRFGQNERSLFSFLLSNEPFGLQMFAEKEGDVNHFYRIHDLYDYTRTILGHRLNVEGYRNHWSRIDSLIERFPAESVDELRILKTVGLLNLLDENNFLASEEAIVLAVTENGKLPSEQDSIKETIQKLRNDKQILYYRGLLGGYCLWPYTSINLEKAYEEASLAISTTQRISSVISNFLETRPLVARRHYIETGNLRYFEIHYLSVAELSSLLDIKFELSDGYIIIPLCETPEEQQMALRFAKSDLLKNRPEILFAVTKPLNILSKLVHEYQCWQWISENVIELNNDSYAAEEVSRQIFASRQILESKIQNFVGLQLYNGNTELQWYSQNHLLHIKNGRDLLSLLSNICDEVYNQAPKFLNELVNRNNPSSAAAAARMRLIEHIFKFSSKPFLGMDPNKKPPEMSMYLSILKRAGLHKEVDGNYVLLEPDELQDVCRVLPVFHRIQELLEQKQDNRIKVSEIFRELRKTPYGVREGLIPLLFAIFTVINEQNIAFYENSYFLQQVTGFDFQRLIKVPETFEIQYCKIIGVRAELFDKLVKILELRIPNEKKADLLDVVRSLCLFAAQLPSYTHKTKNLSNCALAVRNALLNAREPVTLLFKELPNACSFNAFSAESGIKGEDVQNFVHVLKSTLDEMKFAYPNLLEKINVVLGNTIESFSNIKETRKLLFDRVKRIGVKVTEPKLKAFCLRLTDAKLSEIEWIESLGSFVCSKPPSKWHDADVGFYEQELQNLYAKFCRVEAIAFEVNNKGYNGSAMRIAITTADGVEMDQVVHITKDEELKVIELEAEFISILNKSKRVGLAAASRAFWKILSQAQEK